MDNVLAETIKLAKQYMNAEQLDKQEAIEVAAEAMEQDGNLGDYNYLELVEQCKGLEW